MNDSLNKIQTALLSVVIDLLSSKKAIAMTVGVVIAIAGHFGFAIPGEDITKVVGLIGAYVVAQGIADHGKEAAAITARSAAPRIINVSNDVAGMIAASVAKSTEEVSK